MYWRGTVFDFDTFFTIRYSLYPNQCQFESPTDSSIYDIFLMRKIISFQARQFVVSFQEKSLGKKLVTTSGHSLWQIKFNTSFSLVTLKSFLRDFLGKCFQIHCKSWYQNFTNVISEAWFTNYDSFDGKRLVFFVKSVLTSRVS